MSALRYSLDLSLSTKAIAYTSHIDSLVTVDVLVLHLFDVARAIILVRWWYKIASAWHHIRQPSRLQVC